VTKGDDSCLCPISEDKQYNWPKREKDVVYHVISDRGLYRPGEVVHIKGWVRKIKKNGDLKKVGGMFMLTSYRIEWCRERDIWCVCGTMNVAD
jgi:hypothetical protein